MNSVLQIMKQVSPEAAKPYRIIETYLTSEGMRSRICSGVYAKEEAAQARLVELTTISDGTQP